MVKAYTPEERAERRRRSSQVRLTNKPLIEEGDDDASWIADLRALGVDVGEFLKATLPPAVVSIPDEQSDKEQSDVSSSHSQSSPARRLSQVQRDSLLSQFSDQPDANEKSKQRFSQFLDKSYVFDETMGDIVINSCEDMSQKRWQKEVEEDSKNYNPNSTTKEKIEQNKSWALKMARQRTAEAGYKPAPDTAQDSPSNKPIYPKVRPPPTRPLPLIDEQDFDITEPPLNPRELGISPPSLPHQLVDLVPKVSRSVEGIVDGIVIEGTYEEVWELCDSETMVASCINSYCVSYLKCSRRSSLVLCESCDTVSPACPVLTAQSRSKLHDDTSYNSSLIAVRGSFVHKSHST